MQQRSELDVKVAACTSISALAALVSWLLFCTHHSDVTCSLFTPCSEHAVAVGTLLLSLALGHQASAVGHQ
jgi:uncharacterized membrane protein